VQINEVYSFSILWCCWAFYLSPHLSDQQAILNDERTHYHNGDRLTNLHYILLKLPLCFLESEKYKFWSIYSVSKQRSSSTTKFFDVELDKSLYWCIHVNKLTSKVSSEGVFTNLSNIFFCMQQKRLSIHNKICQFIECNSGFSVLANWFCTT